MIKSAISHPRGTPEFVVAHAKWQASRGRRPSEPFMDFRNPVEALRVASNLLNGRCGCGGSLKPGLGCSTYFFGEDFDYDVSSEATMWAGGLGFGSAVLQSPSEAVMSLHLQIYGMTPEQSEQLIDQRTQVSVPAA